MRVLITGGAGFLGGHLAAHLQTLGGVEFDSLGRADCDLSRDKERLRGMLRTLQPAIIFHLAGRISGPEADLDRDNRQGTANLLDCVRTEIPPARIVLVSTTGVYGDSGTPTEPLLESAGVAPQGPYAVSKYAAEREAGRHGAAGGWVAIARISNPVGAHMHSALLCGTLARQVVDIERGKEPVVTLRTLRPKRDFLSAADCARGLWQIASRGERGEIYNVASGASLSIADLVEIYLNLAEVRPIEVRVLAAQSQRSAVQEQWLSNAKLLELGWKSQLSLRNAIREQLEVERVQA